MEIEIDHAQRKRKRAHVQRVNNALKLEAQSRQLWLEAQAIRGDKLAPQISNPQRSRVAGTMTVEQATDCARSDMAAIRVAAEEAVKFVGQVMSDHFGLPDGHYVEMALRRAANMANEARGLGCEGRANGAPRRDEGERRRKRPNRLEHDTVRAIPYRLMISNRRNVRGRR